MIYIMINIYPYISNQTSPFGSLRFFQPLEWGTLFPHVPLGPVDLVPFQVTRPEPRSGELVLPDLHVEKETSRQFYSPGLGSDGEEPKHLTKASKSGKMVLRRSKAPTRNRTQGV